jgi:hypothetical protein
VKWVAVGLLLALALIEQIAPHAVQDRLGRRALELARPEDIPEVTERLARWEATRPDSTARRGRVLGYAAVALVVGADLPSLVAGWH